MDKFDEYAAEFPEDEDAELSQLDWLLLIEDHTRKIKNRAGFFVLLALLLLLLGFGMYLNLL